MKKKKKYVKGDFEYLIELGLKGVKLSDIDAKYEDIATVLWRMGEFDAFVAYTRIIFSQIHRSQNADYLNYVNKNMMTLLLNFISERNLVGEIEETIKKQVRNETISSEEFERIDRVVEKVRKIDEADKIQEDLEKASRRKASASKRKEGKRRYTSKAIAKAVEPRADQMKDTLEEMVDEKDKNKIK